MIKQFPRAVLCACGILFSTLAVVCCSGELEARSAELELSMTPAQAAQARDRILAWMECEECKSKELEAVLRLGRITVPSLIACLVNGPSQANQEVMRRQLIWSYSRLKQYEAANIGYKLTRSETEYIEHYLAKYIARYQIRAAKALSEIGGTTAKKPIEDVLRTPLKAGVRNAIQNSLKHLKEEPIGP